MIEAPKLLIARIHHRRTQPKLNQFAYRAYYLAFRLSQQADLPLPPRRFGWMTFLTADHGAKDGSPLEPWIRSILEDHGLTEADGEIILVTLPRILGYAFNPVSFWLCHDKEGQIRAVLCEVNNTFGESHNYLCAHGDHRPLTSTDWLETEKVFHVSPFMKVDGGYRFRFTSGDKHFGAWIDHQAPDGSTRLQTSLTGNLMSLTRKNLLFAFFRYPMITFMTTFWIHWQGLRLFVKRAGYVSKPLQREARLTATRGIATKRISPRLEQPQQGPGKTLDHDLHGDPR